MLLRISGLRYLQRWNGGQYLMTDGAGNLSFSTIAGSAVFGIIGNAIASDNLGIGVTFLQLSSTGGFDNESASLVGRCQSINAVRCGHC